METKEAKLFKNGGSQAVRIPKEMRFEGDRVRISRMGGGLLIQPIKPTELPAWMFGPEVPEGEGIQRPPQGEMPPIKTWWVEDEES